MTTPHISAGNTPRVRPVTGFTVLVCLLVFFAAVAGVNAVLIRAALSTFAGVETKNPYEAGLSFGREIASAQAQEARHWKVAAIVRAAEDSPTVIEISADDAAGRRLTGLTALALLVHPEDKRLDRALDLTEHSPGAWRARTGPAAGQWDLVIDLSRDGSRLFRSKNRIVLP